MISLAKLALTALLVLALAAAAAWGQGVETLPPATPAVPLDLAQDAKLFFQTGRQTFQQIGYSLDSIQQGVYWTGVQHGGLGAAAILCLLAYIHQRQPPKAS